MKTLVVFLAAIIFSYSSAFSQNKLTLNNPKQNDDFFSWSYELGFGGSSNSKILNYQSQYQYTAGIELSLHAKGTNEFFISYSFQKFGNPEYDFEDPLSVSCLETGPRLHIFHDKGLFVEGAFVTYILNGSRYYDYHNEYVEDNLYEGFSLGFGKDYEINESISMSLSAKINGIFSRPGVALLYGATSRFNFNNKKSSETKTGKNNPARWAFTLLGGANNPDFFVNRNYKWGLSYGVEAALKTSYRMETTVTVLNNHYEYLYQYYFNPFWEYSEHTGYNSFDILIGERIYFNRDELSSFINFGGGLYSSYISNADYSYYDRQIYPYFGIYFGTGLLAHVYKSINVSAGSTGNLIFSNDNFLALHLKVIGGVRFDL